MRVRVPECRKEFPSTSNRKSQILIQPISTEDESSITETAAIIEECAKDIGKEISEAKPYLPFDNQKLEFHLSDARRRYIFSESMNAH